MLSVGPLTYPAAAYPTLMWSLLQSLPFQLLMDLANAANLKSKIASMFAGEHINGTEDRPALHIATRARRDQVWVGGCVSACECVKRSCACVRVFMGVANTRIGIGVFVSLCMYACMHACVCVCVCVCLCQCVSVRVYEYGSVDGVWACVCERVCAVRVCLRLCKSEC